MEMNEEYMINAKHIYDKAERKASNYFRSLYNQVQQKSYITNLTKDINHWKQNHIRHPFLSLFHKGKEANEIRGYHSYIQWLNYTGKLDGYLTRSISYLYMRDLGKALHDSTTQNSIQSVVKKLKKQLLRSNKEHMEPFRLPGLYRMAQKENIEDTFIWLINKLKAVTSQIPEGMDAEHAKRKIIKIVAGTLMHELEEMDESTPSEIRERNLQRAIQLGYAYGLTYPFIDDLLDANILSAEEEKNYSQMIRKTLLTGTVPNLDYWNGENKAFVYFVHSELREAFERILSHQTEASRNKFLEESYIFFNSQEIDRNKDLANEQYTNEELYIPVILKSSSSRLIVRTLLNTPEDEHIDDRTFYYGFYIQLADDFADMFEDLEEGAVTPYTYYLTYYKQRNDLINPFDLYWTVISNLIHHVYQSDPMSIEVILDRAINGLKRNKKRLGTKRYNEIIGIFAADMPKFNKLIQRLVQKASDVDFFDKLLRDHMLSNFKKERKEREEFQQTIETIRKQVNSDLTLEGVQENKNLKEQITEAANYSLATDGKRLRPIVSWFIGVHEYGLNRNALTPLLKSLEYMHTASLIFDDLPAQDNADTRRGNLALHKVYNTAVAELTGLYLTQKAVQEQASLQAAHPETVLRLIQYSSEKTMEMCKGQAMDLASKGKTLTLEQLNTMSFYKTGLGFEASLLMPAILAHVEEKEMQGLKQYAYHAGIAFQIKDDLLDIEGDSDLLGKQVGIDVTNNNSTFVSILGLDGARMAMWDHYCNALEALQEVPHKTNFLKHLLDYFVHRDH